MIVTDHTKSTQDLMAAARKSGMIPPPPPPPRADQQAMLSRLQGISGDAFDREFLSQQRQAHQEALNLHKSYASGGSDSNLKATAAAIVPVVQHHLDQLDQMDRAR